MRIASIAKVKNGLSEILARARRRNEPVIVTHHGKPYAMIHPISERDLEDLAWSQMAARHLQKAWEGEEEDLYDYL